MSPEHEKALKEASVGELLVARSKLAGKRNLAIFVGFMAYVILLWLRWSLWFQIVPVICWFGAAGQHFHLKLIDHELASRKSERGEDDV